MQKRYTENIDQLEKFYQTTLEKAAVEPPAEMWDKVSISYEKSLQKKGIRFRGFLFISFLLFTITSVIVAQYLHTKYTKESDPTPSSAQPFKKENSTPASIKPSSETKPGTTGKKELTKKISSDTPKKSAPADDNIITDPIKDNVNTNSSADPAITAPVTTDTSSTVAPSGNKTEKKKVKFKDKIKQQYQDSTRPLFVPEK